MQWDPPDTNYMKGLITMKQMVILVCGAPVTGKTTTTNTLMDYFAQAGVSVEKIEKPPKTSCEQSLVNMELATYKWRNEASKEVLIIDGPGLNVYDRKRILDELSGIPVVAVWHSRSHIFMYDHNKDKGHTRWNDRSILNRINMDQQPIQREGLEVVYHVGGNAYLDLPGFIRTINSRLKTEYPVPEDTKAKASEPENKPEEAPSGEPAPAAMLATSAETK